MFNLKGLYFYFLAIKIVITKFLKRIYFSTNYYNKSLRSKIPKHFYFYPNPFLLSSFTNYKNFAFKVEDIDQVEVGQVFGVDLLTEGEIVSFSGN